MASYITERVFGQIPMSAQIVIPEDLAPVLKAVKQIPSAEDSQEYDIVQLIQEQPGYLMGHYYQYAKNTETGEFSWVDVSTNIPTGKQAGAGFYVHVGSRAYLMWVDPPGTIGNMRQLTSAEISAGPDDNTIYYVIVDISPEDNPDTAYTYQEAGEDGHLDVFDPNQTYYVAVESNGWDHAEVLLADVNGVAIDGVSVLVTSDIHNEFAEDGCGITNPRLNVRRLSDSYKFILREYFVDGSHTDSVFQPLSLLSHPNTLFFQSDWKSQNRHSIDFIRNKPLLLRKLGINEDGDLIAYADDPDMLKHLYIDDNGCLIFEFSEDDEEFIPEGEDEGGTIHALTPDDIMPDNASIAETRNALKTVWRALGGTVASLALMFCIGCSSTNDSVRAYEYPPGTTDDSHIYAGTPIVTNGWKSVENEVHGLVDPIADKVYFVSAYNGEEYNYTTRDGQTKKDFRVLIGQNTRADGWDGDHGQTIVIGRDGQAHGSADTALGPNTEVDGDFGIAVGWRATAIGTGAIAIGTGTQSGQNYWTDDTRTVHNPLEKSAAAVGYGAITIGRGSRAEESRSISIGMDAKSNAAGAVQIGAGSNNEANTLKYQNVTIVKDGKLVGEFDPTNLDPETVVMSGDINVSIAAHKMTSIECSEESKYGEIELEPKSSRNYEVFLDNTPENRSNLPILISDEGAGLFINRDVDRMKFFKLPVLIKCKEPRPGRVIIEHEYFNDGYVWQPNLTNILCEVNTTGGFTVGESTAQGTELHFLTNAAIVNEYANGVSTNYIEVASALFNKLITSSFFTNEVPIRSSILYCGNGFSVSRPILTN